MYRAQSCKFLHILLDRYLTKCYLNESSNKLEISLHHHLASKHYYVTTNTCNVLVVLVQLCKQSQMEIARLKFYESHVHFFIKLPTQ